MTWENKKLSEICRPKQWKTISKTKFKKTGYKVYGANGLIGFFDSYTHEYPTILVGCRGTCGSIHICDPFSYVNGNAMALDKLSANVDLKYLYFFLRGRGFTDVISGTSQPQIIQKNISTIDILIPPLDIQKKIATVLDKADELIQKRKESIKKLDELLQSFFLDMFGDPVSNPKGWDQELLKDLCKTKSGGTPSRTKPEYFTGNIPWITTVALSSNYINMNSVNEYITEQAIAKSATKIIPKNSILVGTRVGVGKVSINLCDICTNQDITSLVNISSKLNVVFFSELIKQYQNSLVSKSRGATIKGITSDILKNINVIIPDIEYQNRYEKILNKYEQVREKYMLFQKNEIRLFNSLLQKAFKGELKFNDQAFKDIESKMENVQEASDEV